MKKAVTIIVFSFLALTLNAQNNEKTEECKVFYSLYKEFVKIDMYENALPHWRKLFFQCPGFNKSMYIDGVNIYKNLIEKNTNKTNINKYVDTLSMIYDQRINYFGEEGNVKGRKALDLLKYKTSDTLNEEAYKLLTRSIELERDKISPFVLIAHFQCSANLYNKKVNNDEQLTKDFIQDYKMLYNQFITEKNKQKAEKLKKYLIILRKNYSKARIDCKLIINELQKEYEVKPDNINILTVISDILLELKCTENQLYVSVAESRYKIEPSADAAYALAQYFYRIGNYKKASHYYSEAAEKELDKSLKSKYYYENGVSLSALNKLTEARAMAHKAIEYNAEYGDPYILIASVYAKGAGKCGNSFEQSTVYWLAVDYLNKAKQVDKATTVNANVLIEKYIKYWPNKEEAFMNSVTAGDKVKINCWINETTTARFN